MSHPKGNIFKNLPLGRVEISPKGKNLPSGGLKKNTAMVHGGAASKSGPELGPSRDHAREVL